MNGRSSKGVGRLAGDGGRDYQQGNTLPIKTRRCVAPLGFIGALCFERSPAALTMAALAVSALVRLLRTPCASYLANLIL